MIGPGRLAARLRACGAGATIVEFALVAPMFLMMLLGLIESGRLIWTRQTLEDVAYTTARCMSVGAGCATAAARQNFAVARARALGIRLAADDVTASAGVACNGSPAANRVVVSAGFASAARGLVPLPRTVRAAACFPVLS